MCCLAVELCIYCRQYLHYQLNSYLLPWQWVPSYHVISIVLCCSHLQLNMEQFVAEHK